MLIHRNIENCCNSVLEYTSSFADSLHSIQDDLSKISQVMPDSDDIRVFKARMEYTHGEYLKFVKPKIVFIIENVYR